MGLAPLSIMTKMRGTELRLFGGLFPNMSITGFLPKAATERRDASPTGTVHQKSYTARMFSGGMSGWKRCDGARI